MDNAQVLTQLPPFFNYKDDPVDYGYEALQDFYLSWTCRCAQDKYSSEENKALHLQAKTLVYLLIHGYNKGEKFVIDDDYENQIKTNFNIQLVSTKKQLFRTDLIVEVLAIENNEEKKHVLNIENKWYARPGEYQLSNAAEAIAQYYKNQAVQIQNLLIYCDNTIINSSPAIRENCKNNNYKLLSIEDLQPLMAKVPTGNYMFDEYWHRF